MTKGTDVVSPPRVGGAIVGMDMRLVTRSGAEVPQHRVMVHHIVYTDGGPDGDRRDVACPRRPIFRRFFGTSEERRPLTLPRGYGYRVGARDRWRASRMVMNHRPRDRSALLEYRVTVDPSRTITPVEPLWLSVLPWKRHDATLARGPAGFASPSSNRGASWSRRFDTPGAYRVYCSLHPVYMSQYVRVR